MKEHSSEAGHNRGKEILLLVTEYKGQNSMKYFDGFPFVRRNPRHFPIFLSSVMTSFTEAVAI